MQNLLKFAKEIKEQNSAENLLGKLIRNFEDEKLTNLYQKFVVGCWSPEKKKWIDFYPLYFMGTIEELFPYFNYFLLTQGNYSFKNYKKTINMIINKINEFLVAAESES